jgi:hypothetical protein
MGVVQGFPKRNPRLSWRRPVGALVNGPSPDELIVTYEVMAPLWKYKTGTPTLTEHLRYLAMFEHPH